MKQIFDGRNEKDTNQRKKRPFFVLIECSLTISFSFSSLSLFASFLSLVVYVYV